MIRNAPTVIPEIFPPVIPAKAGISFGFIKTTAFAILSLAVASPALARDPAPPPSGIVIHLFGPGSITSNMLPTAPGTPPSPAAASTRAGIAAGGPAAAPAGQPAYVEPTTSEILHQMFVTGDPNNPSKPAPGRVADRPAE